MKSKIINLIQQDIVQKMYLNYNRVWDKQKDYPYLNYFGINFDLESISSIKFYFHVFSKLDENIVKLFLPKTDDFFNYYHLHDLKKVNSASADDTGCAFEIKFYKDKKHPDIGFHYRLKPAQASFDIIGQPKNLPFDVLTLNTSPGINYEYSSGGHVLKKKYFYLKDSSHKEYFSKRFGYDFLLSADTIEYAESDYFAKINTYYGNDYDSRDKANIFTEPQKKLIRELCEQFNLEITGLGYYEQSTIRSVYFFSKNDTIPISSTEKITQYYVDTIGRLIK